MSVLKYYFDKQKRALQYLFDIYQGINQLHVTDIFRDLVRIITFQVADPAFINGVIYNNTNVTPRKIQFILYYI